jgi:hypothetical protein
MPDSYWRVCSPNPPGPDGKQDCYYIGVKLVPTIPDPTTVSPKISKEVWVDLGVAIGVEQVAATMTDANLGARLASVAQELVVELGKKLPSDVLLERTGEAPVSGAV